MIDFVRTNASVVGAAMIAYLSWSSLGAESAKESEGAATKREGIGASYLEVADESVPRPELRDPCDILPDEVPEDDDDGADDEPSEARTDGDGADDGRPAEVPVAEAKARPSTDATAAPVERRASFELELQATLMLGRHARARVSGHDVAVGDEIPVDGIDRAPPVVVDVTPTTVEVEWIGETYVLDLDGAPLVELRVPVEDGGGGVDPGFFGSFFGWGGDG